MIHIWFGAPREGKTYSCTRLAVQRMEKGRKVFSNYPIITRGKKMFSTLVWKDEMIYENIHRCDIIIDEAYRSYSSREFKNFNKDMHTFFATNGHNDIDVHLIAQNPARIDVIIREITNYYHFVKKVNFPLLSRPLYFLNMVYLLEEDMLTRSKERTHYMERYFFQKHYAEAYDTHYYRNYDDKVFEPQTWLEKIEQEAGESVIL